MKYLSELCKKSLNHENHSVTRNIFLKYILPAAILRLNHFWSSWESSCLVMMFLICSFYHRLQSHPPSRKIFDTRELKIISVWFSPPGPSLYHCHLSCCCECWQWSWPRVSASCCWSSAWAESHVLTCDLEYHGAGHCCHSSGQCQHHHNSSSCDTETEDQEGDPDHQRRAV